jgi:hypothetical protein
MNEVTETIVNDGTGSIHVCIEPWAEELLLAPGHSLRIVGRSEGEGTFEVKRAPNGVVVYAWPGSTAIAYDGDDRVLSTLDIRVPAIPTSLASTRAFVEMMFRASPGASVPLPPPKPWWRLW